MNGWEIGCEWVKGIGCEGRGREWRANLCVHPALRGECGEDQPELLDADQPRRRLRWGVNG